MPGSSLTLKTSQDFDLKRVICSYGYFLLRPNHWVPRAQTLVRVFDLAGHRFEASITQTSKGAPLKIRAGVKLDRVEQQIVKAQLHRMLWIDRDVRPFHYVCPAAKRRGFGRMFRSPTLFEDMVKTITGCNVTWRNTINMNRLLCEQIGQGAFPVPGKVAALCADELKATCKVGYRAQRIIDLAQGFVDGAIDPAWYESPDREPQVVYKQLLSLNGFGPYAARNVMQLLGHYDELPIDTETYRHFCKTTSTPRPKDGKQLDPLIEAYYEPYRPYRFLVYWFELWRDYEKRYGDAWTWDRDTTGKNFTAAVLK